MFCGQSSLLSILTYEWSFIQEEYPVSAVCQNQGHRLPKTGPNSRNSPSACQFYTPAAFPASQQPLGDTYICGYLSTCSPRSKRRQETHKGFERARRFCLQHLMSVCWSVKTARAFSTLGDTFSRPWYHSLFTHHHLHL